MKNSSRIINDSPEFFSSRRTCRRCGLHFFAYYAASIFAYGWFVNGLSLSMEGEAFPFARQSCFCCRPCLRCCFHPIAMNTANQKPPL
ncbi:MAG: hypothetical protein IJD39_09965, partial [Clostridia bacterium]|nr:hypothetical protein [Clostridia bacterium]